MCFNGNKEDTCTPVQTKVNQDQPTNQRHGNLRVCYKQKMQHPIPGSLLEAVIFNFPASMTWL